MVAIITKWIFWGFEQLVRQIKAFEDLTFDCGLFLFFWYFKDQTVKINN